MVQAELNCFRGVLIEEEGCHTTQAVHERAIAFALRQAENDSSVEEVCRKMGVHEPTSYRWKKQFAGVSVSEIPRLKRLEDENVKLKRLVADLTLDRAVHQDVLRRKW